MKCEQCGATRTPEACKDCDFFDFLGFCGCGDPEATAAWLLAELKVLRYPDTPAEWFIAYQFDNLGLTEHGTSVGASWLTDKGKEVVRRLEEGIGKP